MSKSKTFKTSGDTGVSVYVNGRPAPIRVEPGGTYETADQAEIQALAGSPEVTEVKATKK